MCHGVVLPVRRVSYGCHVRLWRNPLLVFLLCGWSHVARCKCMQRLTYDGSHLPMVFTSATWGAAVSQSEVKISECVCVLRSNLRVCLLVCVLRAGHMCPWCQLLLNPTFMRGERGFLTLHRSTWCEEYCEKEETKQKKAKWGVVNRLFGLFFGSISVSL